MASVGELLLPSLGRERERERGGKERSNSPSRREKEGALVVSFVFELLRGEKAAKSEPSL